MTCLHHHIEVGQVYEACADCGAIRRRPRPGDTRADEWHVCDLCRTSSQAGPTQSALAAREVGQVTTSEWIYEAARLEAMASHRRIVPETWAQRDEAFRAQMTAYVESLRGKPLPTPEAAHDSWWRKYEEMGWQYGPVRDVKAKTHPDMVPFANLPKDERDKDEVFLALVAFAFRYIEVHP